MSLISFLPERGGHPQNCKLLSLQLIVFFTLQLFNHFCFIILIQPPHLPFFYFVSSFLFIVSSSPSYCFSFPCANPLYHFNTSTFIYLLYSLLAFSRFRTSRPLVACLSIFHPWVPLELKKTSQL